jgi:hypothetical protein
MERPSKGESLENPLNNTETRAIRKFLTTNSEAKEWLNIEEKREPLLGSNSLSEKGLDLVTWSKMPPTLARQIIGRTAPLAIALGLGFLAYKLGNNTVELFNTYVQPALNNSLLTFLTPNFHVANYDLLKPAFDFSRFSVNPLDFRPEINVRFPNPGGTFDPVVVDHQNRVHEALEGVKQSATDTAKEAGKAALAAAAGIFTAIKYHPFRQIKENNLLLSRQLGWGVYHLGKFRNLA